MWQRAAQFLSAGPDFLLVSAPDSPAVHLLYRAMGWATTGDLAGVTSCGLPIALGEPPVEGDLCDACVEAEIGLGHIQRDDDEKA